MNTEQFPLSIDAWPRIIWTAQAKEKLEGEIRRALLRVDDPDFAQSVHAELLERLNYLNNYSYDEEDNSQRYQVTMGARLGTGSMDFVLTWRKLSDGSLFLSGALQCDACPQPFASVVVGKVTHWSIHT